VRAKIAAAVLTVACLLGAAAPARAERPGGLQWRPCPDDRTAQCATLPVPTDWADPYGPRIGVAVARRTASDPARRIGTLVVNPGGPGGSGVDFALDAAGFFSADLRDRFDIVGFDPRGVARSSPVRCTEPLAQAAPPPLVTSAAGYGARVAYNRRLAADCRRHSGPVFDHVDTLSVARDLEALRAALGQERISFYGASYGTLLGQQYAQRYPHRVRAVVLDSVMDHSIGTAAFLTQGAQAAQDSFDEFVAWCARDRTCALRGRDVRALWAGLLARAAAGRQPDPYDPAYRMTVFDLVGVAFSSFYDPQFFSLATFMKEADAASSGVGRRAESLVKVSFPAIFCADWALPLTGYADYADRLAELRARAPQMLFSPLTLSATAGCLGWPSRPANPQRAADPATVPTLLLNARHDPATPYAWARAVAAQLGPKAALVTYAGWGHVVYHRTSCVTGVADRYLIDLRMPTAGITCAGVIPDPFGVGRLVPATRWSSPVVPPATDR
jgi:pimeloyl-ACP methyl ester carboxylesterase